MAYTNPSVSDFKSYFSRDFIFGSTNDTVKDSDIEKAFGEASFNFNEALYSTQEKYNIGYLYLSAHYLVMDLQSSSQGLNSQYTWLVNSRSVGNVSEGYSIPQAILDNPNYSFFTKTYYGTKYLMLILPLMVGQFFVTRGRTHA